MTKGPEIILTQEQQKTIVDIWNSRPENPPSLKELIKAAFPELESIDLRTNYAKSIKRFLSQQKLIEDKQLNTYLPKHLLPPKAKFPLTDEQQEFIRNNSVRMTAYDMAKVLFPDDKPGPFTPQAIAIRVYCKENKLQLFSKEKNAHSVVDESYESPKNLAHTVELVNKYAREDINIKNLSPRQQKDLTALMKYLKTHRFLQQINLYNTYEERELFESEFVRCTYDKNDLSEEEVDQYIIYATEVLMSHSIHKRIEQYNNSLDDKMNSDEVLHKGLVDAVTSLRTEFNACIKRQQSLLSDLNGKRSSRLGEIKQQNSSLVQLIEIWKNEEKRRQILEVAEVRKQKVREEIQRITNMDQLKVEVWGLNEEELLNS